MDPISILVVDDTRQNLITLEAVLEEPGLKVVGVTSAREALRRLLKEEFAAILLDVHMPDMDGFETAALIRQRPLSKHTPILFLTAYAVETQLTKAYALGAVDYMPTPVQPEILKAKVAVFADLHRKRLEVRRQAELLREAEAQLRHPGRACPARERRTFPGAVHGGAGRHLPAGCRWPLRLREPRVGDHDGGAPAAASGLAWADVVSDGRGVETLASWRAAVDRGEPWSCESRFTCRGETRWVHVRTSPIAGDDDRIIGHVGTVEDITPRKVTEARLLEADRRKDEFLAMLAHELRNPLAAISSAVTVARTPHLERERSWSIAVIGRHVRHLEKLIDDLLDVSRITLGKIEMRRERLDLSTVLAGATDAVRAQVADRRQQLEIALPTTPLWAYADPTRLEQVFVNLLANASKYSHDGGRIWFSAVVGTSGVDVHVRDEGIGLDAAMAERVFDLFAQAETGLDRSKGGLGIGLSLAQRLTELHGGKIRVHSEGLGRGAEFVVTLPLADPVGPAADVPGAEQTEPAPHTGRTVLLVDDNVDATLALSMLLTHAGFTVVQAHDGVEALERASQSAPDIVLLDLGLPIVDGYQVAATLRAQVGGNAPLLIAISGYGQPEDRERSKAVGFDHHLVKPIDCDVLLALMRSDARTWRPAPGSTRHAARRHRTGTKH